MGIEAYFTGDIKQAVESLIRNGGLKNVEEIRMRIQRPLCVGIGGGMYGLTRDGKTKALRQNDDELILCGRAELERTVELMSGYSLYAFCEEIRNGFITLPGGHRVGICGQAVCGNGEISHIKNISSINLRIARAHIGIADGIVCHILREDKRIYNTLIFSPVGGGKTTLLRDIVRNVSDRGITVSVIDERSEIAACHKGIAQNDVGMCTDVLDLAPKAKGIMMALRAMAPRVMAVDEIGGDEDMAAIRAAYSSGTAILCTMHSDDAVICQKTENIGIFDRYIQIGYCEANACGDIFTLKNEGSVSPKINRFCRIYNGKGELLCTEELEYRNRL